MDDSHLENTIRMFLRKINDAKTMLDRSVKIDSFSSALYRISPEEVSNQARQSIVNMTEFLYPYLAEAMLRGIDFKEELQKVYGRDSKDDQTIQGSTLKEIDCDNGYYWDDPNG